MTLRFQLVIDCADPVRQTAFWAAALGYVPEPPPSGHPTWKAYYRSIGVPDEELADMGDDDVDSIVDPAGGMSAHLVSARAGGQGRQEPAAPGHSSERS
jgi:Glyoxalase-like domain